MNKTSLQEAIAFLNEIDAWHEFKYSDRQIQLVAPEIRVFSKMAQSEALQIIRTLPKKPSPAQVMNILREQDNKLALERTLPDEPKDDPSEWMTSREYARTQGFETLGELIKHKISEANESKIESSSSNSQSMSALDPSLEKIVGFWDSIGEEE